MSVLSGVCGSDRPVMKVAGNKHPALDRTGVGKTEKRDMEKKEMDVEKRGRVALVSGQLDDGKIAEIVNNGYRVEKRVWGGYIVSDPAMGFTWEIEDMVFDLKRTLGML